MGPVGPMGIRVLASWGEAGTVFKVLVEAGARFADMEGNERFPGCTGVRREPLGVVLREVGALGAGEAFGPLGAVGVPGVFSLLSISPLDSRSA